MMNNEEKTAAIITLMAVAYIIFLVWTLTSMAAAFAQ